MEPETCPRCGSTDLIITDEMCGCGCTMDRFCPEAECGWDNGRGSIL